MTTHGDCVSNSTSDTTATSADTATATAAPSVTVEMTATAEVTAAAATVVVSSGSEEGHPNKTDDGEGGGDTASHEKLMQERSKRRESCVLKRWSKGSQGCK